MEQLPFRVRKKEPEVIYVGKDTDIPAKIRFNRMGADALADDGKIYLFQKKTSRDVLEHEKAHIVIAKDKTKTPKGVTAWLDDEVKADLYTYYHYGHPKHIYWYLHSRSMDARLHHMDDEIAEKHNYYELTKHTLEHMEKVYKKYWDYLPEPWKKDYYKFVDYTEGRLAKFRKWGRKYNPPLDFTTKITNRKTGEYGIKQNKVVKKRDKITGFIVKGVE